MASHKEVILRWLNNERPLKNPTLFSDGESMYSYGHHYEVARRVKDIQGRTVILSRPGYSVSTTRHAYLINRLARPDEISVTDFDLSAHVENVLATLKDETARLLRKRVFYYLAAREMREYLVDQYETLFGLAERFGLPLVKTIADHRAFYLDGLLRDEVLQPKIDAYKAREHRKRAFRAVREL